MSTHTGVPIWENWKLLSATHSVPERNIPIWNWDVPNFEMLLCRLQSWKLMTNISTVVMERLNRTWTRTWGLSVNHSRTLFPPPPNKYNLSLGFSEHLNRSLSPKLIVTSVFDFCLTFRCTGCSSKMWIFQIWRHDWNGSRIGFGNVQLI